MGIRTRHYLLDDYGVPRRLTQNVIANLRKRGGTLPEHASKRRKVIIVDLDADGQKPPALVRAIGRYWYFDEKGSLAAHLWQEQKDAAGLLPTLSMPGHPFNEDEDRARREALEADIAERAVWTPTDDEMEVVIRDIWHMSLAKWRTLGLEVPAARH